MVVELSQEQVAALSATHKKFSKFTGTRWSLKKYIDFVIADAIIAEAVAAKNAQGIRQQNTRAVDKGGLNVH